MRTRRLVISLLACTAVAVPVVAAPVQATHHETRTYVLPGENVYPEGIAVFGSQYYVTSDAGGAVFRGELREAEAEVFVPSGDPSVNFGAGIKATATRLVVAGIQDGLGSARVYDRRSGDLVARFSNGLSIFDGATLVNDVALAPNGDAYLTDSFRPVVYRIPAAGIRQHRDGTQDLPVFMSLEGTVFEYVPDFRANANGIVVTPDGYLLIVNFITGKLFRISLRDQQVIEVDLGGVNLRGGDGMVLRGRTLWMVRFFDQTVAKLTMNRGWSAGTVVSETGDPTFQGPTTAAIAEGRLLVVNSQFSGPGEPPWTVSSIRLP